MGRKCPLGGAYYLREAGVPPGISASAFMRVVFAPAPPPGMAAAAIAVEGLVALHEQSHTHGTVDEQNLASLTALDRYKTFPRPYFGDLALAPPTPSLPNIALTMFPKAQH